MAAWRWSSWVVSMSSGGTAGDEFEVADGGEEGGSLAGGVLPAFAGFEAEREQEGGELGEGLGGGDGVDERDSFDHDFG
jgi:hypothetical protein